MRFYAPEKLGKKQSLTPEGFLLCEDVPIARIGQMLYAEGEVPVEPGRDGIVRIDRNSDEVFRPETIASAFGKAVVNDHPDEDVNPSNWKDLAVGTVQNPRRGIGIDDEFLLADLIITDADAIKAVRSGKREVSCGYDADYETIEPGRGRQHNILFNHVALVEHGRCGPRCAIGDQKMARRTVWDRIMTAFKANDAEAMNEALEEARKAKTGDEGEEGDEGGTHHHVHVNINGGNEPKVPTEDDEEVAVADPMDARVTKIEQTLEAIMQQLSVLAGAEQAEVEGGEAADEEIPDGEEDPEPGATGDRSRTGDSLSLKTNFQDTLAKAEILVPGIKMPTFDAALSRVKTIDAMCAFRRKVLKAALSTEEGRVAVQKMTKAGDFTKMTCDTVRMLFNGASAFRAEQNNGGTGHQPAREDQAQRLSLSEINKRNREFYGAQK